MTFVPISLGTAEASMPDFLKVCCVQGVQTCQPQTCTYATAVSVYSCWEGSDGQLTRHILRVCWICCVGAESDCRSAAATLKFVTLTYSVQRVLHVSELHCWSCKHDLHLLFCHVLCTCRSP